MHDVNNGRWKLGVVVLVVTACSNGSGPPAPPPLSVVNQSNGVATEVEADSWCVDGVFSEGCAVVDGPVVEVRATCVDNVVVGMPDGFTAQSASDLVEVPEGQGNAWIVDTPEGTILIRSEDAGQWDQATWTFELVRDDGPC